MLHEWRRDPQSNAYEETKKIKDKFKNKRNSQGCHLLKWKKNAHPTSLDIETALTDFTFQYTLYFLSSCQFPTGIRASNSIEYRTVSWDQNVFIHIILSLPSTLLQIIPVAFSSFLLSYLSYLLNFHIYLYLFYLLNFLIFKLAIWCHWIVIN